MEYIPYTYLIGWSRINKWYYGVEYGIQKMPCANPKNLWSSYFTSSKIVEQFREIYGEPDIIQIRKCFAEGTSEVRMECSINWEKRVLSKINITEEKWINGRIGGDICPSTNKKIAMMKYGVENVFQSREVKDKIKKTNLKRYGVDHPSKSQELLDKKRKNNIKKYGVSCLFNLPSVRTKCIEAARSKDTVEKRKKTITEVYGVEHISQSEKIKEKVKQTRKELYGRKEVKLIKEYQRVFGFTLSSGWYQGSDEHLVSLLEDIYSKYGVYETFELEKIEPEKKYSTAIRKLQQRPIVKKIKKYKEVHGKKLKLGRCWDRKSEDYLESVLENLIKTYGSI